MIRETILHKMQIVDDFEDVILEFKFDNWLSIINKIIANNPNNGTLECAALKESRLTDVSLPIVEKILRILKEKYLSCVLDFFVDKPNGLYGYPAHSLCLNMIYNLNKTVVLFSANNITSRCLQDDVTSPSTSSVMEVKKLIEDLQTTWKDMENFSGLNCNWLKKEIKSQKSMFISPIMKTIQSHTNLMNHLQQSTKTIRYLIHQLRNTYNNNLNEIQQLLEDFGKRKFTIMTFGTKFLELYGYLDPGELNRLALNARTETSLLHQNIQMVLKLWAEIFDKISDMPLPLVSSDALKYTTILNKV